MSTHEPGGTVRSLTEALWKIRANANKARAEAERKDRALSQGWLNVEHILDKAGIPPERPSQYGRGGD